MGANCAIEIIPVFYYNEKKRIFYGLDKAFMLWFKQKEEK